MDSGLESEDDVIPKSIRDMEGEREFAPISPALIECDVAIQETYDCGGAMETGEDDKIAEVKTADFGFQHICAAHDRSPAPDND